MKKIFLSLLLILSTSIALADNLFFKLRFCTQMAVNYTIFGVVAKATRDEDKSKYDKFVKDQIIEVKEKEGPEAADAIQATADYAWENRKITPPGKEAMSTYDECSKIILDTKLT